MDSGINMKDVICVFSWGEKVFKDALYGNAGAYMSNWHFAAHVGLLQ